MRPSTGAEHPPEKIDRMEYRYVLDCEVAESALNFSSRQRGELIRIFRSLAANPSLRGDCTFHDSSSREIQKKRFGLWIVSYWADHPVNEVRIVGLQRTVLRSR